MSDTNTIIQLAPNQYQTMLDNYASIVEKTNNQLSLGINLTSLSVTILSVFFAVIAIFVAWALWKNSKDQKDRMEQFFSEQEKIIREKNKNIKKFELKFENLINEYKEKLKGADGENKKQLEKAINELKKEKASAGAYIGFDSAIQFSPTRFSDLASSISKYAATISGYEKTRICFKCGKAFTYRDNSNYSLDSLAARSVLDSGATVNIVYCSHCGEANVPK